MLRNHIDPIDFAPTMVHVCLWVIESLLAVWMGADIWGIMLDLGPDIDLVDDAHHVAVRDSRLRRIVFVGSYQRSGDYALL